VTAVVLECDIDNQLISMFGIEHILGQQSFPFAWTKRVEIDVVALQSHTGVVHAGDARGRYEDSPTLTTRHKTQYSRGFHSTTRHDDNVVDFANGRTTCVQQR
jgi:hypothetical protein